jgi:hypothetical protein
MKEGFENVNLLNLKPKQLHPSEQVEEGKVAVLVPKFPGKFAKLFLPKISKTNFRVKLDKFGSSVWGNCDGALSVREIADKLKNEFGESVEPVYDRTCEFIKQLHRSNLIDLVKEETSNI